eukprot:GHVR01106484.1.p1 GENE.GHVR01106484.1~~GHVR01106484.1.p1  ORF type:complete len:411 (+),score=29.06 GHVR01106484.1:442-1674(+)
MRRVALYLRIMNDYVQTKVLNSLIIAIVLYMFIMLYQIYRTELEIQEVRIRSPFNADDTYRRITSSEEIVNERMPKVELLYSTDEPLLTRRPDICFRKREEINLQTITNNFDPQMLAYHNVQQNNIDANYYNQASENWGIHGNANPEDESIENHVNRRVKICADVSYTLCRVDKEIKMSCDICPKSIEFLKKLKGVRDIGPATCESSPHPLNAALRSIVIEKIQRDIGAGMKVLVVGSCPLSWGFAGYTYLSPNLGSLDAGRQVRGDKILNARISKSTYCDLSRYKLEEVTGAYDVGIFVNSQYDIDIRDMWYHLARLNVNRVYTSMICNASVILDEAGVLPRVNMFFRKVRRIIAPTDFLGYRQIEFGHFDETGELYRHCFGNYVKHALLRKVKVATRTFIGDTYIHMY